MSCSMHNFSNLLHQSFSFTHFAVLAKTSIHEIQQRIPGCAKLSLFADYLGLQTTSGTYEKKKQLADFIDDPRVAEFLHDDSKPAQKKLREHLQSLGFVMQTDGWITIRLTDDKKKNRWDVTGDYQENTQTSCVLSFLTQNVKNLWCEQMLIFIDAKCWNRCKILNVWWGGVDKSNDDFTFECVQCIACHRPQK